MILSDCRSSEVLIAKAFGFDSAMWAACRSAAARDSQRIQFEPHLRTVKSNVAVLFV